MSLYLTYDTEIMKDGFGAQYQRIVGIFCLAKIINAKYLHTPVMEYQHLEDEYWKKINNHFGLDIFQNNSLQIDEIIENSNPKTLESLKMNVDKNTLIKISNPHSILDIIPDSYDNVMNELRKLKKNIILKEFEKEKKNIAIHIRRGDVDPTSNRYTNNDFYIKIINILNKKYNNCNICIFSQGNNFEDFNKIKNVKILNDIDILETFEYLCNSDVLVMAKSSLSYLAGLYNINNEIYIESSFWHSKLKRWKYIDELISINSVNKIEGFENYTNKNNYILYFVFLIIFICFCIYFQIFIKKNIYYFLICILLLLFILLYKKREGFTQINLIDWWTSDEKELEKSKKIFDKIIKRPANIYSVMGNSKINKDSLNIQFSGESFYRDESLFDINFIPTDKKEKNVVIFLYAYFYILYNDINMNALLNPRELNKKTDFCLFSVSNCNCEERNNFYKELSKYKKIDSCGKCMNNSICPDNHGSKEYIDFIQKYKFMICFENKSQPNYFTEKLINAYYGKTIPIYWGCSNVSDYINMNSILYLPQNFTQLEMDQLIEKIQFLDNDDFAYNEIYKEPLFKKIPDEFNIDKITEKVQTIINQ